LKFFNHPEGYVDASGSGYDYVYQYKDHLGNVRLSYSDTDGDGQIAAATEILEENNYYPFGIKHGRYNGNINSTNLGQDYKLNGKEYEDALGLNLYEMDMRSYDPTIGRWTSIDPVTHHSMSTYTAFDNNPVYWADPSGADAIKPKFEIELSTDVKNESNALTSTVVDESGKIIDYKDDGDRNIYLNNRDGIVLGQEEDGREYEVGEQLYNVDQSNPDYNIYSLIVNSASAVSSSLPVTIAVNKIPQRIPVYNEAGERIGTWTTKIKVPFKILKFVNGVLQVAGPVGDAISFGVNTYSFANGDMSFGRYSFNTVGTGLGLYTAFAYGGAPGVAVGGIFYVGDLFIQAAEVSSELRRNAVEHSRYRVGPNPGTNYGIFSKEFWRSLNFGRFLKPPGTSGW
jgi:RHS repeat-associated protein